MEVSFSVGMSHLTIGLCWPQPAPSEWQTHEGISPLHVSIPWVTVTLAATVPAGDSDGHRPWHGAEQGASGSGGPWVPSCSCSKWTCCPRGLHDPTAVLEGHFCPMCHVHRSI